MTKEHTLGELIFKNTAIKDTPVWNSYVAYSTANVQLDPTKSYIVVAWFSYTGTNDRSIFKVVDNEFTVVSGSTSLWHTTVSYDATTSTLTISSDYSASPSCMVVLELEAS